MLDVIVAEHHAHRGGSGRAKGLSMWATDPRPKPIKLYVLYIKKILDIKILFLNNNFVLFI